MSSAELPSPEDFIEGQIILIDKPLNWTSFQVVNYIRSRLRRFTGKKNIKVGHAGTLDPLATGLLIVCTGKMTKQIESYMGLEKVYSGQIQLGATTPSFDLETEIDQRRDTSECSKVKVKEAMQTFVGDIEQFPPMFSAIKVEGKRLYQHARAGEQVEVRSRQVHISEFSMLDYEDNPSILSFRVRCSKGTYIRSLARDLGEKLNVGGHLTALRREAIGQFGIEKAVEPKSWGLPFDKLT